MNIFVYFKIRINIIENVGASKNGLLIVPHMVESILRQYLIMSRLARASRNQQIKAIQKRRCSKEFIKTAFKIKVYKTTSQRCHGRSTAVKEIAILRDISRNNVKVIDKRHFLLVVGNIDLQFS